MTKKKKESYSNSLQELEGIVKSLENGESNIDDLAEKVKRATKLIQDCKKKLRSTEKEISESLGQVE